MLRAVWFCGAERGDVLLITAHHLAVDVVSWHIMLGDIAEAWRAVQSGAAPKMLPEFTSYRRWSELMWERAADTGGAKPARILDHAGPRRRPGAGPAASGPDPRYLVHAASKPGDHSGSDTERVLAAAKRGVREFLLAATTIAIASWRRERGAGSGRGHAHRAWRAMGAPTPIWTPTPRTRSAGSPPPFRCGSGSVRGAVDIERAEADPAAARALLESVIAHLAAIPHEGLDYGLLRYVDRVPELQRAAEPQIQFGYLGRLDLSGATDQPWSLLTGPVYRRAPDRSRARSAAALRAEHQRARGRNTSRVRN